MAKQAGIASRTLATGAIRISYSDVTPEVIGTILFSTMTSIDIPETLGTSIDFIVTDVPAFGTIFPKVLSHFQIGQSLTGQTFIMWEVSLVNVQDEKITQDEYVRISTVSEGEYSEWSEWLPHGVEQNDCLPLTAGEDYKLTGPLGLTQSIMYGSTLPETGFEGQLFFLEDISSGEYLPRGGLAGQVLIKNSENDGDASWQDFPELDYLPLSGGAITGTTESTSPTTGALTIAGGLGVAGNVYGTAVYGATWNDYAEYRSQVEEIKPGYCVTSNRNGEVSKTTEKLQYCEGIVSDTFGFAIGENEKCKTPLAVSGRVLAYYNGNIEDYNIGDVVCAGPDGKIMRMTREEIREWPDRIIGTVSEFPSYKVWGTGKVSTVNRIWIKIR